MRPSFFWTFLVLFVIAFVFTLLAIAGTIEIQDYYLKKLFAIVIIGQTSAVLVMFKKTDFLGTVEALSQDSLDLLATLWKYQKQCFANSRKERWCLRVDASDPEYPDFITGAAQLRKRNLAGINNEGKVYLTNKGYQYSEKKSKKLSKCNRLFYLD